MLSRILSQTPPWVWALLAALVALGLTQARSRRLTAPRLLVLPAVMTGLALAGTLASFGFASPAPLTWLAALLATATLVARRPAPRGTAYDAAQQRFLLPGSFVPLALILLVFTVRYSVNVALAITPALKGEPVFAAVIGGLYGALGGLFAGRAAGVLRLR